MLLSFRPNQLGVSLQDIHNSQGIVPRLLQRIFLFDGTAINDDGCFLTVDRLDSGQSPIFDLEDDQASAGVHDDKVRVKSGGTDGHVVPAEVILLQLCFQQMSESSLAGRVEFTGGYAGDEGGHG